MNEVILESCTSVRSFRGMIVPVFLGYKLYFAMVCVLVKITKGVDASHDVVWEVAIQASAVQPSFVSIVAIARTRWLFTISSGLTH